MPIYSGSASGGSTIAGVCSALIDNEAVSVSDVTYNASDRKNEELIGQNAFHGFSNTVVAGMIGFKMRDAGNLSHRAIARLDGVQVTVHLANGKTIYGTGMKATEVGDVDTKDGNFDVKFVGPSVTG